MNPLLLLNWRVAAAALLAIVLAASHWAAYKKGEKTIQAEWDAQSLSIARQSLKLSEEATRTTTNLEAATDQLKESKDAQITTLSTRLAVALDGLRKRPERPGAGDLSKGAAAGANTGCTGANLFRPDADFLVREAHRADQLLIDLAQCQDQYNTIRKALNK